MRSVLTEGDINKIKKKHGVKENILSKETKTNLIAEGITTTKIGLANTTSTTDPPSDNTQSAMSKFIPGEAVAIFVGVFGILGSALPTTPIEWIGYPTFIACLVIALGITYFKATNEKVSIPNVGNNLEIPGKYVKTALTGIAFVIWAINIEGFINLVKGNWPAYDPIIGGIFLIFYTVLIPGFYAWLSNRG